MSKKYHIRELEKITGIKAHTIRMWEKRYNLITPERSDTNIRFYNEKTFKKFLLISQLYHSKFKISEIAKFTNKEIREKALLLNKTNEEYEAWDLELFNCVVEFNDRAFILTLQETTFAFDFNKTIVNLLIPFLHKIDVLWKADSLNFSQRQFAFENAFRFLYSAIYTTYKYKIPSNKKVLLYTDNNEMNIFSVFFAEYIFKKMNYSSFFIKNITDNNEVFNNLDTFNTKNIVTIAPENKKKIKNLLQKIKNYKNHIFYLIDTKFSIDVEIPNLILINNLEDLEDEIYI